MKSSRFRLLVLLLCSGFPLWTLHAGETTLKIATVDLKRLFEGYEKAKRSEQSIEDLKKEARRELDARSANYRELLKTYQSLREQANDEALTVELRQAKQAEAKEISGQAGTLQRQIQEFTRKREAQLSDRIQRLRRAILKEIQAVIQEEVRQQAFDLIIDRSATSQNNGVTLLTYSRDAHDLTDRILARLNAPVAASEE